jgi:hypothetical protein
VIDLTNQVFGRLTARWPVGRNKHCTPVWLCSCVCGNLTYVPTAKLRRGHTRSCGCFFLQADKHGYARSTEPLIPEYRTWLGMKTRCFNPRVKEYPRYGGRGIGMCERWRVSFPNFLSDMGFRPSAKHSIDRFPDNNGNYEPGNCRWATAKQQQSNTRPRVYSTRCPQGHEFTPENSGKDNRGTRFCKSCKRQRDRRR